MADINPTDRIMTAMEALLAAIAGTPTALGRKQAHQTTWDNDTAALAIPAGAELLHVYCEGNMELICNDSAATYAGTLPCVYPGGVAHILGCKDQTYLHYRNAEKDNDQEIAVTSYGS